MPGAFRFRTRAISPRETEIDCALVAYSDALEAVHTAGIVDDFSAGDVDARGAAAPFALAAGDTLAFVDADAQGREAAHEPEGCADGADVVAPCTAVGPCEDDQADEGDAGDYEQRQRERLAGGEGDHAPVGAVRRDQQHGALDAGGDADNHEGKNSVAEPLPLLIICEVLGRRFLPGFGVRLFGDFGVDLAKPDDYVLKYAQGADDCAVAASDKQGRGEHAGDYRDVEAHDRREELELGHPSPPVGADAGEEQRYSDDEQRRKNDSGSFEHTAKIEKLRILAS